MVWNKGTPSVFLKLFSVLVDTWVFCNYIKTQLKILSEMIWSSPEQNERLRTQGPGLHQATK